MAVEAPAMSTDHANPPQYDLGRLEKKVRYSRLWSIFGIILTLLAAWNPAFGFCGLASSITAIAMGLRYWRQAFEISQTQLAGIARTGFILGIIGATLAVLFLYFLLILPAVIESKLRSYDLF